ncbi:MAG: universal stress protein [Asgard group archaeon]|nr:universal stress protein [Asgard group archaeon]
MSLRDPKGHKIILEETYKKISELLPSVGFEQPPIENALIIVDGTARSRTAILIAGELNKHFNTKIDIIHFYPEQSVIAEEIAKESYEDSLAFTYEHLRSEVIEIKGPVVENTETLKIILDNTIKNTTYDLIIIPSSVIGMKKEKKKDENLKKTEAKVVVIGEIFDYLLEDIKDIPVLVVESEKVNLKMLWKNICIFLGNSTQLSYMCEKALRFSLKNTEIRGLVNVSRSFHEEKTDDEFEQFVNRNKKDLNRFVQANFELFKEVEKFKEFNLSTTDKIDDIKNLLAVCGENLGFLIIYMPTKHSSLAGFFIEFLEDPEITFPILIAKKKITPPIKENRKEDIPEEEKRKKK